MSQINNLYKKKIYQILAANSELGGHFVLKNRDFEERGDWIISKTPIK